MTQHIEDIREIAGTKPWHQSKTIWGALIAVAASLLQFAGLDLAADIRDEIATIAVTLSGAFGGLLALYGRVRARDQISGALARITKS